MRKHLNILEHPDSETSFGDQGLNIENEANNSVK